MTIRAISTVACATLFLLSIGGCASQATEDDDEAAASSAAALGAGMDVDGLAHVTSADPRVSAQDAAAPSADDKGCRTRRIDPSDPNVVHVTLDHCTKRFGRHVVSGEMTLTFSQGEAGALHVERRSTGLTVDGRPASHTASTDITFAAEGRVAKTRGVWQMTREDGAQIMRTGEHTVTFDATARCRVASGTSVEERDGARVGTGTLELSWCELPDGTDTCPVGLVEHDRPAAQKRVEKRFDGSATVSVSIVNRKGTRSRSVALACTPQ